MKDHEIAQTINQLRDIAIEYRDAQQLRQQIHGVVMGMVKRLREGKGVSVTVEVDQSYTCIDIKHN